MYDIPNKEYYNIWNFRALCDDVYEKFTFS